MIPQRFLTCILSSFEFFFFLSSLESSARSKITKKKKVHYTRRLRQIAVRAVYPHVIMIHQCSFAVSRRARDRINFDRDTGPHPRGNVLFFSLSEKNGWIKFFFFFFKYRFLAYYNNYYQRRRRRRRRIVRVILNMRVIPLSHSHLPRRREK